MSEVALRKYIHDGNSMVGLMRRAGFGLVSLL